jgi:penicillin-binding protein 1C
MSWASKTLKVVICLLGILSVAFAILWAAYPFPEERLPEVLSGGSSLILDREEGIIAWRVDTREAWRFPVGIDEVSPWLVKATLAAEDKRFWSHFGMDPLAVMRAIGLNLSHGRRISGASTITMQTMRLIWPRARTYRAKFIESFRALELEQLASKEEILELYLNLAPYGGNVVGVEAAARRYFGKRAADLTLGEAALIAGIPQSPARFNPEKHLGHALRRRSFVFARMREEGLASTGQIRMAEREPMQIATFVEHTEAQRFADLVSLVGNHMGGVVRTTLDPQVQMIIRPSFEKHAGDLKGLGVDGTSVVVVDVATSELLAMIGSSDPADPRTGCINGATARRQPGSLLKPFLYAKAFDTGILTPQTVVYDVPLSWGGYRPQNMDRKFLGPIPASRALLESRNIPAVRLLERVGLASFSRVLNEMDLKVAAPDAYGLSLALGTPEMRLIDMANAYGVLARLGSYRSLGVLTGVPPRETGRVFSEGASYLALRSMGASSPDGPFHPAWKTGTSWNHRDAWAVVLTPKHVIGVWCGKLSGQGDEALTGAHAALPLALDICEVLTAGTALRWTRPGTVRVHRVCAISGALPHAACRELIDEEYLPGTSHEGPCTVHRFVTAGDVRRIEEVWPAEAASFLAVPAPTGAKAPHIEITSPSPGGEYLLSPGEEAGSGFLHFSVASTSDIQEVFWFLNGEFLARASSNEALKWPMREGNFTLLASSGDGLSEEVRFLVVGHDP